MTQVSKYPLNKEIEKRMFEIFLDSVVLISDRLKAKKFLEDWLSPTEQLMLAKRLSIALLLTKGFNQRAITKILKVGLETVNKVSRSIQNGGGGYNLVMSQFIKQEKIDAFWEKLDDKLADLFPPRHRDWSHWRRERWEEKMKRRKPY